MEKEVSRVGIDKLVYNFSQQIRRGKINRVQVIATEVANLLLQILYKFNIKNQSLLSLLEQVKYVGKKLSESHPTIFVIGNIIRRCLFIIREEIILELKGKSDKTSTEVYHKQKLSDIFVKESEEFDLSNLNKDTFAIKQVKKIKVGIISEISDFVDDMESSYELISNESTNQIHENEIIFTLGHSHTVFDSLRKAATGKKKKIKFKVIVAEHAPSLSGHMMAKKLTSLGIETTLIPDSAVFAVMSRVNRVIIGTRAIMANGGLIAESGTNMVTLSAKKHSIPVVVCAALYKLTPIYPTEKYLMDKINNPKEILEYTQKSNVNVINPEFDYIPPEFVNLMITSDGIHTPTYVYRLLSEYYDPQDSKF